MYQDYYGLRELPFELSPDPRYLFFTPGHREALSNLEYGLSAAKALTVIIGEAGTGKTTLIRAATDSDRCRRVDVVRIDNPLLTRNEFVELLARRFNLSARAELSKATLLSELETVLLERRRSGQITALVIDEAQSLSTELLEEVRLLANLETTTQKLLPLVMAGQPELRDRLNEPGLRQLKQRVTLRCEIAPFTVAETASYVAFRIATAGGDPRRIFTRDAVLLIHEHARGIPRVVSVLSDNALLTAFGLGRRPVDRAVVAEVVRDFDVERIPAMVPAPGDIAELPVVAGEAMVTIGDDHPGSETETANAPDRELFATSARRRFRLFGPR